MCIKKDYETELGGQGSVRAVELLEKRWTLYLIIGSLQYSGDGSNVVQKMHRLCGPQIVGNLV
jgi:hypothetical protein